MLFDAYTNTLCTLVDGQTDIAIEQCLRRFECQLLIACGYLPSLTHDARSRLHIDQDRRYLLIPGEGFVLAERGFLGAHLAAFASDTLDNDLVRIAAKQIMRCLIDHALNGKKIQSRMLYKAVQE
jgi:recombinational DNA repair protein (RecF pathway)